MKTDMYVRTERFAGMDVKITEEGGIYRFETENLPGTKDCTKGSESHVLNHVGIIVLYQNRMLLAKKTMGSWPGYWIFGGRRKEGESPKDAASRIAKSKLGLNIDPSSFSNFCTFIFVLPKKGSKNTSLHVESIIMSVEIGPRERSKIKCGEKKYKKEARFFLLDAVINKGSTDDVHPAVRLCAMKIIREKFNPKLI